jgi:hypothetical protein
MYCEHCQRRFDERNGRQRRGQRSRVAKCERCGTLVSTLPGTAPGAGDGTLAHLARFGLAITGDPLLELKREGT